MRTNGKGCRVCHREDARARYWADPQAARDAARAYALAHPEERAAYYAAWRAANIEQQRAYALAAYRRRRMARNDPDTLAWITLIGADPCSYCGAPTEHVDHIVPVKHGGENHWTNYAPACAKCNHRKHARSLLGFLLLTLPPPEAETAQNSGQAPTGSAVGAAYGDADVAAAR